MTLGSSQSTVDVLPLYPTLWEEMQAHAVPLLLDLIASKHQGGRYYGLLDFLPTLLEDSKDDDCLRITTDAFANAFLATQAFKDPARDPHSSSIYRKALRELSKAIACQRDCSEDKTLAAIWILGKYEMLVASPEKDEILGPQAWHYHVDGLVSLIRLRGRAQFSTRRGRKIFWETIGLLVCPN
jgi:hypothetical protein